LPIADGSRPSRLPWRLVRAGKGVGSDGGEAGREERERLREMESERAREAGGQRQRQRQRGRP